jgi:translation elongation factor EF-Ts
MLQGFSSINTSVERGFASTAFETQKQTCDLIKNQDANTDKIIAWLNANKQSELEEKLSLARVEISQRNQTDAIFERLRNNHNNCCNPCGGCC